MNDNDQPLSSAGGYWAVVPAAGSGQRMSSYAAQAKQYLNLHGITMLQRTLERLLDVPDLLGIVVVLAEGDELWPTLSVSRDERIHTTIGGACRADSVAAGLVEVRARAGDDAWVLVHDAARPVVSLKDIQRLLDAVINSGAVGGLLAAPVQDTVKQADEHCLVETTVPRTGLWLAQTPQLFKAGELAEALSAAPSRDAITDESSAMELQGHDPLLVEALDFNPKITRPMDLSLVEAFLQSGVVA